MFGNKPADQASNLADQAALSADHALKATRRAASDALTSLAGTVPLLDRATEQISALAHSGMDSVRDTSRQLRNKTQYASDCTVNYIKDEPVKSVLIAAATGAALMALISLMGQARRRH